MSRVKEDPDLVSDAMKSFPSGHAQMSCFAAAFIIVSFRLFKFVFVDLFVTGLPECETGHHSEPPGQVLVAVVAGGDGQWPSSPPPPGYLTTGTMLCKLWYGQLL